MLTAALTSVMLQISGPSGDSAWLLVQALVISVLGSRTPPWLRLSDASFARSSRRSGRFSAQVGLSATFPPCHNRFRVSLQRTSAAEIYRSRQLSAALSALPAAAWRSSAGHSRRIFGVGDKLTNLDELPKTANVSRVMARTAQS